MITFRSAVRVLGGIAVLVGIQGTVSGAGAQVASTTYSVRARADSVGLQFIATELPVVSIGGGEVAFVTATTAQSEIDALGSSRAFASAPYPGDLLVSLPGTAAGFLGGADVPSYPAYVASSHPTDPERSEEAGPYGMTATSSADASESEARIGVSTVPPQVVSATARTSVRREPETGVLAAEAMAEIAPFSVADLLRIGDIRATAAVVYDPEDPAGASTMTSSLSVGTITIAGVEVGLTDRGLTSGANPVVPVDVGALTSLLDSANIQLEYVPAEETETTITSAAVRVSYQETFPSLGLTTVRLVLGQVSATADPGGAVGGGGGSGPDLPPPAGTDAAGSSASALTVPLGRTTPLPGPGPITPAAPVGGVPPVAAPTRVLIPGPDLWEFYPALVVGGLVALATSRLSANPRKLEAIGLAKRGP